MLLQSLLGRNARKKTGRNRRRRAAPNSLAAEQLEPRTLLAVMSFVPPTGISPPDNLLQNGSFEDNQLAPKRTWDTFKPGELNGWTIVAPEGVMAEIQRVGLAKWKGTNGSQWLELDGDETGPGVKWNKTEKGRAERGLYAIEQHVQVKANIPYELSFDYAGRPGRKTGDNRMGYTVVDAGGQTIFNGTITAENNASKTPVWQTAKTVFTPTTSGNLLVRFGGQGTDNTFGMLLDNTVLVKAQVESGVDLDIDSNNDNRLLAPDRSPLEDDIEGDQAKKIVINDNDTDGDGVPDYADGFGYDGLPETQQGINGKGFTPIVLQIPENLPLSYLRVTFSYAGSDPMNVGAGFALPDDGGMIRLWTENASVFRNPDAVTAGGNYIPSEVVIEDVTALGFTDSVRTQVFYVEGVRLSEGNLVPISVMVTTADDDTPVGGDVVNVAVVSNTIVIGIDGTSQQDWLTGPHARRPADAKRWNSHVRNLIEDVNAFAMVQYDFGSVDWAFGSDSPAIATRMIERAEETITDAGGGTTIAVVGWSRGGMIAIQVANTLSLNAGGGLPRDVVFAGLYDPVAESNYIPAAWGVVDAGVDAVTIVGARDPAREAAADVVNVDWRVNYRTALNDKDFRCEAYFDKDASGLYTIPRIRHDGGEALMTRFFYNASHGGIGGTPGYNERHLEPADGGKYDYALDVTNSFQSDKAVRDGMRAAGLNFVPDRLRAWYGFAATRPI